MTNPTATVRHPQGDRGAATIAVAIGAAVALLFVVQLVNVIVFQYGQGAVRSALDEGARAGSRGGGTAACEARADAAIHDLAAGMADGVAITCAIAGQTITATATVAWQGWLTSVGDYQRTIVASAALEDR